jgi:hypothetical protein
MNLNFLARVNSFCKIVVMFYLLMDVSQTYAQGNITADSSITGTRTRKVAGWKINNSGYGGIVVKLSAFDGQFAFMTGGRGAITINNRYTIGGAGYGIANSIRLMDSNTDTTRNFKMGYGGLELGYIFFPGEKVNVGGSVLFALGAAFLQNKPKSDGEKLIDNDFRIIPVLEPSLYCELTLNSLMRLHTGISYRYVNHTRLNYIKDQDIRGFTCFVGLLFGKSY